MATIKNIQERIVAEKATADHQPLEDNSTFEETIVKVEAYESERDITQVLGNYVPGTEEERRLVKKVDLKLLPIFGVMYAVQCVDRSRMNDSRMAGEARELYGANKVYSWMMLGAFVGHLIVVIYSNMLLSRHRPSRYIPSLMIVGGSASALMSASWSVHAMLLARVPLVAVEAAFLPAVVYLLSCWYRPKELAKRVAIFPTISIVSQFIFAVIGRVYHARRPISHGHGVIAWRYLALLDGVEMLVAAIVAAFVLPDYPATTRSLSRRERELATIRLIRKGQDTGSSTSCGIERLTHVEALAAAFRDPRVHMISLVAMLTAAVGSLSHLLTTTTIQTGFNSIRAHHVAIPVYIVSILLVNLLAWTSDRSRDRRWHIVGSLILALIGVLFSAMSRSTAAKVVFSTIFAAGIWSTMPLALSWAANTIRAPAEKRAIVIAIVHGVAGIASILGAHMWPRSFGARHHISLAMSATFLGLAALIVIAVPSFVRLDSYRGTIAERKLELRRRQKDRFDDLLEC